MLIIGTAGHIDHSKTTLVHALTGMDTDKLAEEKRRGISIDLGFAHLTSPSGIAISFIDVPGHERFIKNMLAGVGGISAVLLVIAADEGVKPQTREHFDICRLLQIPAGLVVLTKTDAATPDQIASTRSGVASLVKGSFLQNAPVLSVSAKSGDGLASLRSAIYTMATGQTKRAAYGLARLNVDRSFAAKGFGSVVTGTLLEGQLRTGDTVQVHPIEKPAKIRSLQVHGNPVETATAGSRAAVNLTGIEHSEVQRGYSLTHRNELTPTSLVDVSVEWLYPENVPAARESFLLHIGTAEIPAHLKVIGSGYARLWLSSPTLTLPGDRFILRRPSPAATVGGGTILDCFPPARLNRKRVHSRLTRMELASWPQRIELLVEEGSSGRRLSDLVKRTGLPLDLLGQHIASNQSLVLLEPAQKVIGSSWLAETRSKLVEFLRDFHAKNPNAAGASVAQARLNLEPAVATAVFSNFAAIRVTGDIVALATHKLQSNPEHLKVLAQIEQAFRKAGFQPASPAILLQEAGTDAAKGRPFLEALIKAQRLIRVSDEIVFHADVITQIRRSLGAQKGRKFTIPEFKEWTQVSRKYAVPLLEYLDRQHVTKREGDTRIIL